MSTRIDDVQGKVCSPNESLFRLLILTNISLQTIVMHSAYSFFIERGPAVDAAAHSLSENVGLLLLCEVAAKPFFEQYGANYDADRDCKAAGARCAFPVPACTRPPLIRPSFVTLRCTKGLGRTQPAEWQDAGDALENPQLKGCHMPKGPGRDVSDPKIYLQYNEVRAFLQRDA